MALGSGAASVFHKVKCLVQKIWPEAQSMQLLRDMLSRVRCACVDMGTEFAIPDLQGPDMADLLPSWLGGQTGLEPDAGDVVQGCRSPADTAAHILPNCMVCPGTCHILHNMSQDVDTPLSFFPQFLEGFGPLAYLLNRKHLRQRFVATCLFGTRHAGMAPLFKNATCPEHATWRWGSLGGALRFILKRKNALRAAWDARRFSLAAEHCAGPGDHLDEGDKNRLKMETLTTTIKSRMW